MRTDERVVDSIVKKEGLKIIHELAKKCDVVLDNFPPGKADKLGVGYKQLSAINPKIVAASITG
jgi:crotonobetainyl-CoA:carnitine CoA-transferase CaiB-like acyl-CoA transferase